MPTFTVGFWYTQYGTALNIEAETKEEAEQWLFDELQQNGLDEFEYEINERDYGTNNAKELAE